MTSINDIMTTQEAAERWGLTPGSVKHLCTGIGKVKPRLLEGKECRKSGGVWIITREGMERLYGKEQPKQTYYFAEFQNAGSYRQAEKLKAKSLRAAKREASMRQAFYGTVLEIGCEVNEDGFILNPVARKEVGKQWKDVEVK